MEKAYDLKALGQLIATEAKKDGLHLSEKAAEALAKSAYIGFKTWYKVSAQMSPNKADDLGVPFIDFLDQFVLPQIDKLDLDGDGV